MRQSSSKGSVSFSFQYPVDLTSASSPLIHPESQEALFAKSQLSLDEVIFICKYTELRKTIIAQVIASTLVLQWIL